MSFCFKQESNDNNDPNSGPPPSENGVQPNEGGVHPIPKGISCVINNVVWITIINVYLQMVYYL